MPDPNDLLANNAGQPRRFGDYLVHGLLGEGGMARIYAAEELLSHRPVALKVLRSEFARSDQGRRQFLTEMGILANLDDPHIVRCLSCVEIEQQPVMVLEQLDGWTLREMLNHRVALPWAEAAGITLQIARALDTAHSQRPPIVHRDLKPENVMCLRDGRVKVMDFGIAKVLQTLAGSTTHPVGTLQYMSPEHIDAQPVDGRADLFALGLVFWEMLVGRPPFQSDSPRVLLEQICTQPTPPLPERVRDELPLQLEQFLSRLLGKRPEQRPASATEVILAFEPFVGGPGLARERSVPEPRMQAAAQASTPVAPAPQLDTMAIVDSARKHPLQRQVEQQFDEAAEVVSRFGRATSAAIVRVLVGLMILPAAAVVFVGVPLLLLGINVALLDQAGANLESVDDPSWLPAEAMLVLALSVVVVFVRACWGHRREPGPILGIKPWLGLGGLLALGLIGGTALQLDPGGDVPDEFHATFILSSFIWMTITLSLMSGRITSRILRRLERARE